MRILFAIAGLVREERPLVFFAAILRLLVLLSLVLRVPVVLEYLQTRACSSVCQLLFFRLNS